MALRLADRTIFWPLSLAGISSTIGSFNCWMIFGIIIDTSLVRRLTFLNRVFWSCTCLGLSFWFNWNGISTRGFCGYEICFAVKVFFSLMHSNGKGPPRDSFVSDSVRTTLLFDGFINISNLRFWVSSEARDDCRLFWSRCDSTICWSGLWISPFCDVLKFWPLLSEPWLSVLLLFSPTLS